MDKAMKGLYEAAVEGSVTSLINLLQQDALILERCMVITCYGETPLHVAAMLGHADFCLELLRRKPELAAELDSRRSSPLHLASAKGYTEIAKALVSVRPEMCFACDCDGNNPIHVAAMKGKLSVLKQFIQAQPDAARARADRGDTILHLCVQYCQLDVLKLLVDDLNDQELVNAEDDQGNTILHLAVADKQVEIVRYLLTNTGIDVNALNSYGLTALDILAQSRRDVKYIDIADCLLQAAAQKSEEKSSPSPNLSSSSKSENQNAKTQHTESTPGPQDQKNWGHYFNRQQAWLNKQRDALMVIASLVATMAFQAGVSPPSGVWQDNQNGHTTIIPGYSILAYRNPVLHKRFVAFNTASFISSLSIVQLLISGLPFKHKVFMWILMVVMWISVSSTAMTYAISIAVTTPPHEESVCVITLQSTIFGWISLMSLLILVHAVRFIVVVVRKTKRCIERERGQSTSLLKMV